MSAFPLVGSRYARIGLLAIFCGHASLSLIYDALPPIMVEVAAHFGGGERGIIVAQLASSLPYFGVMLAGLLTPVPVRWWGYRKMLLGNLILYGLLGSAGAVIDDAWILLVTRFGLGFAVGSLITCCMGYVALKFDDVHRTRLAGWMLACGAGCGVIFILISGFVAASFGWRAPFLLHFLITGFFLLPVLCMEEIEPAGVVERDPFRLVQLRSVFAVYATAFVLQFLVGIFFIQLALLIGSLPFGSPQIVGVIFAVVGISSSLASFSYGRWFVHIRPTVVNATGFLVTAAGIGLGAVAWTLPVFILSGILYGSGSAIAQASLFTWAMEKTPPALLTNSMGLVFTSLYLGIAIGPTLAAPLPVMLGVRNTFLVIAVGIVIGLCISWLYRRRARPLNA
ncbi:hypothetical protein C1T17_13520 [Sphingobium sp. SCG-1]|uniref:MFS transporter n=1 Tax=Sphingobium sp. SCG-1 TaxID=2072936 RepID=UPI000CD6A3EA|nr:MFS transporter [Sphingobium sp. SCG-1]AUW58958.1 hypothetical protein C1T17_13520 [Sphingobium sp. SCG-1]